MCQYHRLKIKEFVACTIRECAECAMDLKEALDSAKVVKEPKVKGRRLQKKRRDTDQAPKLALRVGVKNPSEAALESWPSGEMKELMLPDELAEEEHAKQGVGKKHDHDGTEERGFWWCIRLAYGNR
jgi:hypothetical protein